jgi:hypothetical protein
MKSALRSILLLAILASFKQVHAGPPASWVVCMNNCMKSGGTQDQCWIACGSRTTNAQVLDSRECPPNTELWYFWDSAQAQTTDSCWSLLRFEKRKFNCVRASNSRYPGELIRGMCFGGYRK